MHDQLMRDTLVFGTKSEIVRKKCITEGNNLTFAKAHEIARTEEATRLQLQAMENKPQGSHEVDSIKDHNQQGRRNKYKPPLQRYDTEHRTPRGEHNRNNAIHKQPQKQCHLNPKHCPATGAECFHCHKIGHFSKMCRSNTNLNEVRGRENNTPRSATLDNTGNIFLGTLEIENNLNSQGSTSKVNSVNQKQRCTKVLTSIQVTTKSYHKCTTELICKVDTGAEINVISKKDFDRILARPESKRLKPTECKITAYGGQEIKSLGICKIYIHHDGGIKEANFNVTEIPGPAMLSCETCEDLGLVQFNCSIEIQRDDQAKQPLSEKKLLEEFEDCFQGLGTFKMKPYHITLDPTAEPVIHVPRTVPITYRTCTKKK